MINTMILNIMYMILFPPFLSKSFIKYFHQTVFHQAAYFRLHEETVFLK